jgi:hypothetical protein
VFDKSGRVTALVTTSSRIAVQTEDGRLLIFTPREVVNPLDDETIITDGLAISFNYDAYSVTFGKNSESSTFSVDKNGFSVIPYDGSAYTCSPSDCAGCSLGCK